MAKKKEPIFMIPIIAMLVGIILSYLTTQTIDFSLSYPALGLIVGLIIALVRFSKR